MIKLKIIFRSLFRQKLNTGIIIASLAIGIACVNLIAMFVQRELNTDSFHKDKDRIYALKFETELWGSKQYFICLPEVAEYLKDNFTQVEDFCRVDNVPVRKLVVNNETYANRIKIIQTSNNFFEFFTYPLLTNNPKTALEAKNNLVISEELAHKYFGSANAVGQVITLDNNEKMVVSGIFRKPVDNSQLSFDMVRNIRKDITSVCYIKLRPDAKPAEVASILKANKNSLPSMNTGKDEQYFLQSLNAAYFDDSYSKLIIGNRNKSELWTALIIGLVILCIATFNYLGLLNNNLLEKNKVFAIQHVNGGSKFGLVLNAMAESLVVIGISFIISLFIMLWMAPFFNGLVNTNISFSFIFRPWQLLVLCSTIVLLLIITFLFISFRINTNVNFNVLKHGGNKVGKNIQFPAFQISQLASSLILIIFSIIIIKQMTYITNKPLGIDKEVIEVKVPDHNILRTFKQELMANPSIEKVTFSDGSPLNYYVPFIMKYQDNGVEKEVQVAVFPGGADYIETLGFQVIEGTGFTGNWETDKNTLLINESMAKLFPGKNLIGTQLPDIEKTRIVKGIVKDFHFTSLKSFVEPACIKNIPGYHMLVKPSKSQIKQAHAAIAQTWKKLIPDYPLDMETIGEQFEGLHRENRNYLNLIVACCFISVFLSMIGLFSISYQNSRFRTKEIGIRKVNGARILEVMFLLNNDAVRWVIIAFVIACPIGWYATHRWLESFAYKTALSWWIFAFAGLLALATSLFTVSWQSWRAATRNPLDALRYE